MCRIYWNLLFIMPYSTVCYLYLYLYHNIDIPDGGFGIEGVARGECRNLIVAWDPSIRKVHRALQKNQSWTGKSGSKNDRQRSCEEKKEAKCAKRRDERERIRCFVEITRKDQGWRVPLRLDAVRECPGGCRMERPVAERSALRAFPDSSRPPHLHKTCDKEWSVI